MLLRRLLVILFSVKCKTSSDVYFSVVFIFSGIQSSIHIHHCCFSSIAFHAANLVSNFWLEMPGANSGYLRGFLGEKQNADHYRHHHIHPSNRLFPSLSSPSGYHVSVSNYVCLSPANAWLAGQWLVLFPVIDANISSLRIADFMLSIITCKEK